MTSLSEDERQNLGTFLAALRLKSMKDQIDAITNAVLETGGTWDIPDNASTGSTLVCISLFEVTVYGASTAAATRSWIEEAGNITQRQARAA